MLREKLARLDELLAGRRRIAARYDAAFGEAGGRPGAAPGTEHSFHLYVIRSRRRDELAEHLDRRGIGNGVHYRVPLHLQPAYADACLAGDLPEAERAAAEVLSLPLFPGLTEEQQDAVIEAVAAFG